MKVVIVQSYDHFYQLIDALNSFFLRALSSFIYFSIDRKKYLVAKGTL